MTKKIISLTKEQEDEWIEKIAKEGPRGHFDHANSWKEFKNLLMPLVASIVKKYIAHGYPENELKAAGERGLNSALYHYIKNIRKNRPYKFSTYSAWWIRAEIHKVLSLPIE